MKVASTRDSLILALKNDKNSERWEEFVNQYWDYLYYAACKVDKETGRCAFIPDGVDPGEAVEQTFWQLKNIILPDFPQFDVDFTEDQLAKKVRYGLKWRIFELEKGKRFRNYLLSVLKNVARSLYNARKTDRLVFVDNQKFECGWGEADDPTEAADYRYEGYGESDEGRVHGRAGDEETLQTWEADFEAFERGEIQGDGQDESENDLHIKRLAAQYAIEAVMADPRIERQTKEIYGLLIEHAQNGRHGDGAFEAIAARFKVSPASVYKHRQRMEDRLQKYYKAFLDAREVRS
ncbi:MAG: hypothetical protein MJ240_07515 [Kiritimatiellae bacterium]|nr:hypothetical protein [Kiritimatiellia bacterium]